MTTIGERAGGGPGRARIGAHRPNEGGANLAQRGRFGGLADDDGTLLRELFGGLGQRHGHGPAAAVAVKRTNNDYVGLRRDTEISAAQVLCATGSD